MKGARGAMDETQGGIEGGSKEQWMKHKGGMERAREGKRGLEGAMDETQGTNQGGSRGQWIKNKGGMKGARGGNG